MLEWIRHCSASITCAGRGDTRVSCSPLIVSGCHELSRHMSSVGLFL